MSERMKNFSPSLLKGNIKELCFLFFPLLLVALSSSSLSFIEKIFFSHLGSEVMQAAVNVTYACRVFQMPSVLLAMMAQVCVGRLYGSREWCSIGPVVWQFIWFSILSSLVTVPLGVLYGKFYFAGTDIETVAIPYYYFLIAINFLYPLGAALSCFYLGLGRTRLILVIRLLSELLTAILAFAFILGKIGMPRLGLIGGGISVLVGQGGLCFVLFAAFLNHENRQIFCSGHYHFSPTLCWHNIKPGILRSLSSILGMTSWASTAHLMIGKGGEYLRVLSVGGTLFLFLSCFGEALCQAMTTIVSQIVGSKQHQLLRKAFHSGMLLSSILIVLVGVIFFSCSGSLLYHLFPDMILVKTSIFKILLGVWFSLAGYILIFVPVSFVLAFKDTHFSLVMGLVGWINGFLWMYWMIQKVGISADQFWIALSFVHFSSVGLYYLRMKKLTEAPFTAPG